MPAPGPDGRTARSRAHGCSTASLASRRWISRARCSCGPDRSCTSVIVRTPVHGEAKLAKQRQGAFGLGVGHSRPGQDVNDRAVSTAGDRHRWTWNDSTTGRPAPAGPPGRCLPAPSSPSPAESRDWPRSPRGPEMPDSAASAESVFRPGRGNLGWDEFQGARACFVLAMLSHWIYKCVSAQVSEF